MLQLCSYLVLMMPCSCVLNAHAVCVCVRVCPVCEWGLPGGPASPGGRASMLEGEGGSGLWHQQRNDLPPLQEHLSQRPQLQGTEPISMFKRTWVLDYCVGVLRTYLFMFENSHDLQNISDISEIFQISHVTGPLSGKTANHVTQKLAAREICTPGLEYCFNQKQGSS